MKETMDWRQNRPNLYTKVGARGLFVAAAALGLAAATDPPAPAPEPAPAFSFEVLRQKARELAAKEYRPNLSPELPDQLKNLNFDQYQDIRFRPEAGPWHNAGLPFDVQFFHRGALFKEPVRIHLVERGQVRDVQFSPSQFDYGKNHFPQPLPAGLHFAGVRVIYWPPGAAVWKEIACFLGASYFRLVGFHQRYGAAARGLAIDTGEPGGEEFPRFSEFWLEKPGESADTLRLFALLESDSATGAYQFVIHPGEATWTEVEASVFVRKGGKKLGLAPLTSMFLMGENRTRYIPDYRPEVHDSDGLLLQNPAGNWLWRPLVNPDKKFHISHFPADHLAGFGLLQRDRNFYDYEDLEARYDLRPSLWVQPRDSWDQGTIELVEIPSPAEWNDNIVAYWVPRQKPGPGHELRCAYNLTATLTEPHPPGRLLVQATRVNPPHNNQPLRFLLDFTGDLRPPPTLAAKVEPSQGQVRNVVVQTNEVTGGWRAFFDLVNAGSDPVTLRLSLLNGSNVVSETWVYRFENP